MWMCKTTDSSSVCQRRNKHETVPQFVIVCLWRLCVESQEPFGGRTPMGLRNVLALKPQLVLFHVFHPFRKGLAFIRLWAHEWRWFACLIQKWTPGAGRNVIFVRAVNSSEDRTHGVRFIACEFSLIPVCALGCSHTDILNIEITRPETVRVCTNERIAVAVAVINNSDWLDDRHICNSCDRLCN